MQPTTRRQFLAASAVSAATAAALTPRLALADGHEKPNQPVIAFPEPAADAKFAAPYGEPLFKISVAQWSLNKLFWDKKLDNRDYGKFVREEYDLDAVEWVNQFFKEHATDFGYIREMKQRCDDHGVKTLLIMVDGEGQIGHPDAAERKKTVENHMKWVVATKLLGGHSIRVNAGSKGSYDEQVSSPPMACINSPSSRVALISTSSSRTTAGYQATAPGSPRSWTPSACPSAARCQTSATSPATTTTTWASTR